MKNTDDMDLDLEMSISKAHWKCGCGQENLRCSITRKGSVQAHCYACGRTIYFNDAEIFRTGDPWSIYQKEQPIIKKMKNGGRTYWYPKARVRMFII